MPDSCGPVRNRSSANKKAAGCNRGSRLTAACCYPVATARKSARCWSNSGGCRFRSAPKTAECCCRADRRCLPRVDDRCECSPCSGLAHWLHDLNRNPVADDRWAYAVSSGSARYSAGSTRSPRAPARGRWHCPVLPKYAHCCPIARKAAGSA